MSLVLFSNKKKKNSNMEEVRLMLRFSSMEKESFALGKGVISGVAVPYGKETNPRDWRKVSFEKGAIKNLHKVSCFVNHQSHDVKAMIGVAEFEDSQDALRFTATLNQKDDDVSKKIIPLIEMGALEGVSVGVWITKREIVEDEDGDIEQVIVTEAEVYELSLVTFQAFEDAKIEASQQEQAMNMKTKKEATGAKVAVALNAETKPVVVEETPMVEEEPVVETASIQEKPEALELAELRKENALLKQGNTDSKKKIAVEALIASGVVHKAQTERIMNQFNSANSIQDFYKDVPASYSVTARGEDSVDVTNVQLNSEANEEIASQLSSVSAEDIEKYGPKQ